MSFTFHHVPSYKGNTEAERPANEQRSGLDCGLLDGAQPWRSSHLSSLSTGSQSLCTYLSLRGESAPSQSA